MARKYSRDNRGRFASSGTGATARGGRLKTASGGKRATQTRQIAAAPKAGTVGKPKGLKQGAVTAKAAQAGRARRSTVVPALQGSNKLAPLSPQRKQVLGRANARATTLADMSNKAKDELKKAQNKAIPANNQYSDMTPKARKAAITRLAKAEKAVNKINKSSQTAQRARAFAEGLTGATKQGYKRYDNDVRRSDIRTPRRRR